MSRDSWARSRRPGSDIEPEMSMTKVRAAGGRSPRLASAGRVARPTRTRDQFFSVGAGAVDGDREAVAVGAFVVLAEAVDELLGADRSTGRGAVRRRGCGGHSRTRRCRRRGRRWRGSRGTGVSDESCAPCSRPAVGGGRAPGSRSRVRAVRGLAAVVAAAARAAGREQQAARRRECDEAARSRRCGAALPAVSFGPLHRPCPLGPLTSTSVTVTARGAGTCATERCGWSLEEGHDEAVETGG